LFVPDCVGLNKHSDENEFFSIHWLGMRFLRLGFC